jgi:hypothetical protein
MSSWQFEAAQDPNTSPEILSSLFDNPKCHDFLIKNPSSPKGLLAALGVKEAFTSDPMNNRMAVAEVLSKAKTPQIIERILNWTEGYLNVLQAGEDPSFVDHSRLKNYFYPSAAENPNTPVKYLKEFARTGDSTTIFYLGPNPSLPKSILDELAEKLSKAETHDERHEFSRVPENINLSSEYLIQFSKHPAHYIRAAVARNPSTPKEAQVELAGDSDSYVLSQLQYNNSLCEEALLRMCHRTKGEIRNLTQWVDDYFNNLRKRALSGSYSEELKKLVTSHDWPK